MHGAGTGWLVTAQVTSPRPPNADESDEAVGRRLAVTGPGPSPEPPRYADLTLRLRDGGGDVDATATVREVLVAAPLARALLGCVPAAAVLSDDAAAAAVGRRFRALAAPSSRALPCLVRGFEGGELELSRCVLLRAATS